MIPRVILPASQRDISTWSHQDWFAHGGNWCGYCMEGPWQARFTPPGMGHGASRREPCPHGYIMNRERLILQRRIRTKQQLLWDVVFLAMLVIVGSFGAIAIAIITIPFLVQMSGLLYYRWSTARTLRRVSKGSLAQLDGCFMPYRRDDLVPWLHGRW